jgi:hypothetical protein
MLRRLTRWTLYLVIAAAVLITACLLLIDPAAKSLLQNRLSDELGLKADIGSVQVGLKSTTLTLKNLRVHNSSEFGGGIMLDLPEVHLEYDSTAIGQGRLKFKTLRLNLAEVAVVENKEGRTNFQVLQERQKQAEKKKRQRRGRESEDLEFGGVNHLVITLGKARFISLSRPELNRTIEFGLREETFKNLHTEKELETALTVLLLKAGASFLLETFSGAPSGTFMPERGTNSVPKTPAGTAH